MIYVFFDLDETVLETVKTNDEIYRNISRVIGVNMSEEKFQKGLKTIFRKNMLKHMDFAINESIGIDPLDYYFEDGKTYDYGDLKAFKNEVYADMLEWLGHKFDRATFEDAAHAGGAMYIETKPGILEAVSYIRNYAKTGLITNGTHIAQWKKIKSCGAENYFDDIFVSGDFGLGKPDPKFYSYIISETLCDPAKSFMVGDNIQSDYMGSLAAGLNPIFFSDKKVNYGVVRATNAEEVLNLLRPFILFKE